MTYTTIQISRTTREKLNRLRPYKRATYDDIILTLMELVPEGDEEGKYTDEFRASLLRGLLDIKSGRTYSLEDVKMKLGIR